MNTLPSGFVEIDLVTEGSLAPPEICQDLIFGGRKIGLETISYMNYGNDAYTPLPLEAVPLITARL